MLFLSFYAIVKDEAANLARCLDSIKPYVDELVIVDTGSTDDTVLIAQRYGAKIGHFTWCNDFAAARNYALSLVSGLWVLTLDADEALVVHEPEFRSRLTQPDAPIAYGLDRKDLYEVSDIIGGTHLRLFQNRSGLKYHYPYHEQLLFIDGIPVTLEKLDGIEILHYGNSDENILYKNLTRDIPVLERMRSETGLDLWRLDCLARKYTKSKQLDKAQDCYAEALDRLSPFLLMGEKPDPFFWIPTLLESLGVQALEAEDIETVRLVCQRGLEWCPNHPPLNYLAGDLCIALGLPRGALAYFQYCLEMGKDQTYFQGDPFPMDFVQSFPAYGMGCVFQLLQDTESARQSFQMALTLNPNYKEAQDKLLLLE
jgi:tetratricopeptide (TPR) repeat protein